MVPESLESVLVMLQYLPRLPFIPSPLEDDELHKFTPPFPSLAPSSINQPSANDTLYVFQDRNNAKRAKIGCGWRFRTSIHPVSRSNLLRGQNFESTDHAALRVLMFYSFWLAICS